MMQGPSIVEARLFNLAHQTARLGKGYANTMGRYCRQPPYTTNTHGTLGGRRRRAWLDKCTGKHAIAFRPWFSKSSPGSTNSPSAGRSHGTSIELRSTWDTHPIA